MATRIALTDIVVGKIGSTERNCKNTTNWTKMKMQRHLGGTVRAEGNLQLRAHARKKKIKKKKKLLLCQSQEKAM